MHSFLLFVAIASSPAHAGDGDYMVRATRAGVSTDALVEAASNRSWDLEAAEIADLLEAGVAPEVVEAMVRSKGPPPPERELTAEAWLLDNGPVARVSATPPVLSPEVLRRQRTRVVVASVTVGTVVIGASVAMGIAASQQAMGDAIGGAFDSAFGF